MSICIGLPMIFIGLRSLLKLWAVTDSSLSSSFCTLMTTMTQIMSQRIQTEIQTIFGHDKGPFPKSVQWRTELECWRVFGLVQRQVAFLSVSQDKTCSFWHRAVWVDHFWWYYSWCFSLQQSWDIQWWWKFINAIKWVYTSRIDDSISW